MFNKSLRYSVAAQKHARYRVLRVAITLLFLFLLFNVIHTFLFSVWVIQGDSMQPGLQRGDRLLVFSSALPSLFTRIRGRTIPYNRGNIVIIDRSRATGRNPFMLAADSFVRFFTAQRVSILDGGENLHAKRIIGIPGDEVSMVNFVMRVRPADSAFDFTEFELARRPYYPTIPHVPALWDMSLPFSGNMDGIVLGPGESFVMSDDRGSTSDSRSWGPIDTRTIIGRPIFRFWPPTRIGFP